MANLFNQRGEKIRFGVAGVKKCLMDPDKISDVEDKPSYAMVWNDIDGYEVYISRDGESQRSFQLNLTYWIDEVEFSIDFEFADRDKAIDLFLEKVKNDL